MGELSMGCSSGTKAYGVVVTSVFTFHTTAW
jgi:hypothetical protein